ncbi:hypothetical protein AYO45_00675 [Gammaproteobacteria bacterium SCGC AG-212-F23]|nr:hypothetical protein AYO45_00675 [Gammaproteobacteria bacterium SCGC AG-212-F23]
MLARFFPWISKKEAASGPGPDAPLEVFPNMDSFPKVLESTVLDYVGGDILDNKKARLTLFGRSIQQLQAPYQVQKMETKVDINQNPFLKALAFVHANRVYPLINAPLLLGLPPIMGAGSMPSLGQFRK